MEFEVIVKALEWLRENDPGAAEELELAMMAPSDIEAVEEIVRGVPDSVTGREEGE